MKGKKYYDAKDIRDLLDSILPEYKRISQADPYDTDDQNLYKSANNRGDVYLVENPAAWREVVDDQGNYIRVKRPAQLIMTADQAEKSHTGLGVNPRQYSTPSESKEDTSWD